MKINQCLCVKAMWAPLLVGLLTGLAAVPALGEAADDGFVEVAGVGFNSLVELKDGSLLSNDLRISTDGGKTWAAYGNVCFAGENVYLIYLRGGPRAGVAEQITHKQVKVMRIYPLTWFYK